MHNHVKGGLFFTPDKGSVYFVPDSENARDYERFPWDCLADSRLLHSFIRNLNLMRREKGRGIFCYSVDVDVCKLEDWFERSKMYLTTTKQQTEQYSSRARKSA